MAATAILFYTAVMRIENAPTLTIEHPTTGTERSVVARGIWQVHALARRGALKSIDKTLKSLSGQALAWDLSEIASLDHIGAQMFWNAWGKRRPDHLKIDPKQE